MSPPAASISVNKTSSSMIPLPTSSQECHERTSQDDLEICSLVGMGAFAQVFLVRTKTKTTEGSSSSSSGDDYYYALKVIDKKLVRRSGRMLQVMNEKQILERLHHPGILKLYSTFHDPINIYYVLEFCSGGDLGDLIRKYQR
jgi:serine/threonine protein kinase